MCEIECGSRFDLEVLGCVLQAAALADASAAAATAADAALSVGARATMVLALRAQTAEECATHPHPLLE